MSTCDGEDGRSESPSQPAAVSELDAERRTRRGKVARLPHAVREELNLRLQDGEPFRGLLSWLNGLPEVAAVLQRDFHGEPIGEDNLSRWKTGGYVEWEDLQRTLDAVTLLSGESTDIQKAAQDSLANRVAVVLTANLAVQLRRLQRMPDSPKKAALWQQVMACVVSLRRGDLQAEKLHAERLRIEQRASRTAKEREAAFLEWAQLPENKERVKDLLFASERKTKREVERETKERVTAIKRAIGLANDLSGPFLSGD